MFKHIVVPTDFSKLSLSSIEYAEELARKYDSDIHIIYVLEKTPPFLAMRSLDITEDEIMTNLEEQALNELNKVKNYFSKDLKSVETVLRKGLDHEEIVDYANELEEGIIVIATHGRTGLMHTLLGSVAQKVIRYARCPVLVITPETDEI
jgi:universal stress protein A